MYSKPIDIIQLIIRTDDNLLDVKIAYEDIGFTPCPGDILASYKWFGKPYRVQVINREYESDVGVLRLNCIALPAGTGRAKSRGTEPERVPIEKDTCVLAPFLSTDGTGREEMTAANYKEATRINSFQNPVR